MSATHKELEALVVRLQWALVDRVPFEVLRAADVRVHHVFHVSNRKCCRNSKDGREDEENLQTPDSKKRLLGTDCMIHNQQDAPQALLGAATASNTAMGSRHGASRLPPGAYLHHGVSRFGEESQPGTALAIYRLPSALRGAATRR